MDGAESVLSERSTRSQGSSYYHTPSAPHWQPPPPPTHPHPNDAPPPPPSTSSSSHAYARRHPSSASSRPHSRQGSGRHRDRDRDQDRDRDRDRDRDGGGGGGGDPYMSRAHHSGQDSDMDNHRTHRDERIEVQVIPQDDNWGETTTAITGNTSETGYDLMDNNMANKLQAFDADSAQDSFSCVHHLGTAVAAIVSVFGFVSPIVMVILPRLDIIKWPTELEESVRMKCLPECEGLLISFSFKLLILLLGTLAVFVRRPKATMPRMFVFRAVVLFLTFVITFAFWLFYGVRIVQEKKTGYHGIVQFADSLVDGLLFIHYLALVLLELRQLQPQFVVTVTRSPDGESNCYSLGVLTLQRAAVTVLEHYYRDFPAYNPYLDMIGRRPNVNGGKQSLTGFKVYNVDGTENNQSISEGSRAMFAAAARRRDSGHNDRFYDELEYERRVRKRRARLLVAAEEAFTHIKRLQEEQGASGVPMDPQEAAQAVFPSMARALQKYLRITRQQPRHSMESVLIHLATCISHDLSPRAFMARYLTQGPVILAQDRCAGGGGGAGGDHRWVMVCEQNVIRELEHGLQFQLRCGGSEVSLLCQVRKIPHFSLTEDVRDPKTNRFVLRLNSETSV